MDTRFVALVRGINVGPTTKVAMVDLREVFGAFDGVSTLLNSGNVLFSAGSSPDAGPLEEALAAATGVSARILVLPIDEMRRISDANPLRALADDDSRLLTTFLDRPVTASVPEVEGPERIEITDAAIYQWCPAGVSKSAIAPSWWKSLGVLATARNQKTIDRILAAL